MENDLKIERRKKERKKKRFIVVDVVGGYGGYHDWNPKSFRGGFMTRRPFRGYRNMFNNYHEEWMAYQDHIDGR